MQLGMFRLRSQPDFTLFKYTRPHARDRKEFFSRTLTFPDSGTNSLVKKLRLA